MVAKRSAQHPAQQLLFDDQPSPCVLSQANIKLPASSPISNKMFVCGIYRIVHTSTNKQYIGSSLDVGKRWKEHRKALRRGNHDNRHLQEAWKTYGESAFLFEVIEETTPGELVNREQHYLDTLMPYRRSRGFNIAEKANGGGSLLAKHWIVTFPDGHEERVYNLQSFCRKRGIDSIGLRAVARCDLHESQGYRCRYPEMSKAEHLNLLMKRQEQDGVKWATYYRLMTPTGEVLEIYNLAKFCRERLLNANAIRQNNVRGWKCERMIQRSNRAPRPSKSYVITHPDGREEVIPSLGEFAQANGLNAIALGHVARGILCQHRGWKCRKASESRDAWEARIKKRLDSNRHVAKWLITAPDGTEYRISGKNKGLRSFCKEHAISHQSMKRNHKTAGWSMQRCEVTHGLSDQDEV